MTLPWSHTIETTWRNGRAGRILPQEKPLCQHVCSPHKKEDRIRNCLGAFQIHPFLRPFISPLQRGEAITLEQPDMQSIQAFSILNQLVEHEPLMLLAPTALRNGPSMSFACGCPSPLVTTVNTTPGCTAKPLEPRLAEICCFEVTFQIFPMLLLFLSSHVLTDQFPNPTQLPTITNFQSSADEIPESLGFHRDFPLLPTAAGRACPNSAHSASILFALITRTRPTHKSQGVVEVLITSSLSPSSSPHRTNFQSAPMQHRSPCGDDRWTCFFLPWSACRWSPMNLGPSFLP